jgi:hypothetical protein
MHTQVMGNSVEQWYKTYDLHFNKEAGPAIDNKDNKEADSLT